MHLFYVWFDSEGASLERLKVKFTIAVGVFTWAYFLFFAWRLWSSGFIKEWPVFLSR